MTTNPNTPLFLDQKPTKVDLSKLPKDLLINGEWRASRGGTLSVLNPATGEELCEVAAANADDLNDAISAARGALEGAWRVTTSLGRAKLLNRLADLIERDADELAELEVLDNGMPLGTARYGFIPLALDTLRYSAGLATKIHGRSFEMSVPYMPGSTFASHTRREPIGVVGAIIPWNAPLLMAVWKLAPALAAGCTIVLKPAEQTPLIALRLGELIVEAGFPPGVVNILNGTGETIGAAMSSHQGIDKIAFTGSTEVGKMIVRAASGNLKRVSLELGGKSPNIVFDDADLDAAVAGAGLGIFFNSGQNCAAGSRLYVQERAYDRVLEGVAAAAAQMKVGNGLSMETQIGPLVSCEQLDRVLGFVDRSRKAGAEIVVGGGRIGEQGNFVSPTVVAQLKEGMDIVENEVFGPVLSVIRFTDEADVIRQANASRYGLAAGLWTKDATRATRVASRLQAGTIWINTYNAFSAAAPFGGYKESGWGRELGEEVLENYLHTKAIIQAV